VIPLNTFTVTPVVSAFLPPLDGVYDPLFMQAPGGIALNDGTQGREVQTWTVFYDGANIVLEAQFSGVAGYVLPVDGVLAVSVAFDTNMAIAFGYMKADGGYLYYFDSLSGSYQTLHFSDITSCRVVVDKTSSFYNAQSDVIFAYTKADDTLNWRQQRDRYGVEYPIGSAGGEKLIRCGPSLDNRFQLQLFAI
jgi:hypothetical protein